MRVILTLIFLSCVSLCPRAQNNESKSIDFVLDRSIDSAIKNAKAYLKSVFTVEVFEKHIELNNEGSFVIYQNYKMFLNNAQGFEQPIGHEFAYNVIIGCDTLFDAMYVPLDANGAVTADSTTTNKNSASYSSHKKLLFGQYKFGYGELKDFILKKKIEKPEFFFDCFDSEDTSINKKQIFKYYWYVNDYKKIRKGKALQYIIDPGTGKIRKHYLENIVIRPDALER